MLDKICRVKYDSVIWPRVVGTMYAYEKCCIRKQTISLRIENKKYKTTCICINVNLRNISVSVDFWNIKLEMRV